MHVNAENLITGAGIREMSDPEAKSTSEVSRNSSNLKRVYGIISVAGRGANR